MLPTTVRLGNSGLKVSRIILGTMQYGDKDWQEWVLGEEEAIKHIKIASAFIMLVSIVV
jgi:aryl-alcohol dehydrogenase-like predicted oxidoreductase